MTPLSVLSAFCALAFVLWMQRRFGCRVAGFTACLPLTSAPLALVVWSHQGAASATHLVMGSMEAVGAASVALTVFAVLRAYSLWSALVVVCGVFVACLAATRALDLSAFGIAALSATAIAVCAGLSRGVLLRHALREPTVRVAVRGQEWLPFAVLAIALISMSLFSPRSAGWLATAPILACSVLIQIKLLKTHPDAIAYAVDGGFTGLIAKLLFFVLLLAAMDFHRFAPIAFTALGVAFTLLAGVLRMRLHRSSALQQQSN
jgi:hypothetical protein